MHRALLLPLAILATITSVSHATEEAPPVWWPERIESIKVLAGDNVVGGCWPRPNATAEAVELVLRSAGIKVVEPDNPTSAHHTLALGGIGYALGSDSCAVNISILLHRAEALREYDSYGTVIYGLGGGLLTGSRSTMQGRITEMATEFATRMANTILRARGQ